MEKFEQRLRTLLVERDHLLFQQAELDKAIISNDANISTLPPASSPPFLPSPSPLYMYEGNGVVQPADSKMNPLSDQLIRKNDHPNPPFLQVNSLSPPPPPPPLSSSLPLSAINEHVEHLNLSSVCVPALLREAAKFSNIRVSRWNFLFAVWSQSHHPSPTLDAVHLEV